jgi:uncharacterized protein
MIHVPVGIEDAVNAGINLQFSGHTHNGQLFPFTLYAKILYPQVQAPEAQLCASDRAMK